MASSTGCATKPKEGTAHSRRAVEGRLGGDEFGLIPFDTRPDEANRACRQLVQRIRDFAFEH